MAEQREQLATSGVGGNNEDWWYLITEENGDSYVTHEWSYLRIRDFKSDNGSRKIAIDDFLRDPDAHSGAKKQLTKLLSRGSIG